MASLAIGLYERAATLDPDEPTPLLGLANIYERQGQYGRALPHLERVLRVAPGHREARLRRGIMLLRLARIAEGDTGAELLGRVTELYFGGDMNASVANTGQVSSRITGVRPAAEIVRDTWCGIEAVLAQARARLGRPGRAG